MKTRPSAGMPQNADEANPGTPPSTGVGVSSSRRYSELGETDGSPLRAEKANGPMDFTISGDRFMPLNARNGTVMEDTAPEQDAALREITGGKGLRQQRINSGITAHSKVTIPSEGGPDSQRS